PFRRPPHSPPFPYTTLFRSLVPRLPREEIYGMRSQMTRAVTSIPANIAEGWTRESAKEKVHFLSIAHGSAAETETLVTLSEDLRSEEHTSELQSRGHLVCRL